MWCMPYVCMCMYVCAYFVGIILDVLDSWSGTAWGKRKLENEKKEEAKKRKRRRRFLLWVRAILVGPPTWKCLLKARSSIPVPSHPTLPSI